MVKAQQFLLDNAGTDPAELKPQIEAQDWDESVEVLATALPETIEDMATHVEWTETMGEAMVAQSGDVLAAIQLLRQQAMVSGALISGEQQTVEMIEDNSVIITRPIRRSSACRATNRT